ncbi:hypothetical protein CEUSTIGMA_g8311.t1 [Chlamydomonas eustigma]|uniref:Xylanase inhibitor N-terminal domain-containing protein n=1 Tax=Chlamydomonas eustigma TaxID=1157962 RepID=A0A250XCV8_9CHLO|nr:hypothetical protein CEUSTIGMA_g8311.t1 [Chlamydomonas eustigma]|eukprot:GAX80876.1 hypothetical protein CEUSTIGMA_g8311.t1 [Chlamydomonas eustigma]
MFSLVLTHLGGGMFAGSLSRVPHANHHHQPRDSRHLTATTFIPQRTVDQGLGQYTVQFLLNGVTVNSVIDTGSGVGQLACTGTTINPAYSSTLSVYNPTSSAFTLVSNTSAACTEVCAQTQQCIAKPAQSGACEYYYAYADQSFLYGRVYTANMTFPSSNSNVTAPNIIFGCSYNTSTNPCMYDHTNSLFGMDWEPLSMWNQLISQSIVKDTLYLCLGNGGDSVDYLNPSISSQAGVIIFGDTSSVSLSGTSAGGDTITATMLDSVNLKDSNGNQLLAPASMWLTLNSLSLVNSSGSTTSLSSRQRDILHASCE